MRRTLWALLITLAFSGCEQAQRAAESVPSRPQPSTSPEPQDLALTLGGFLAGGPQSERVTGQCGPAPTRDVLTCDIYNGLPKWTLQEVTLVVVWTPYRDEERRYFQVPVSIEPLSTKQVTVRLGLTLPADEVFPPARTGEPRLIRHWSWLIVGAKGIRAQ